jgi:hypothetical protein
VVRTLQEKTAAVEAARGISGVLSVDETIAVETPNATPDHQLDAEMDEVQAV